MTRRACMRPECRRHRAAAARLPEAEGRADGLARMVAVAGATNARLMARIRRAESAAKYLAGLLGGALRRTVRAEVPRG